ncbi:hypothetical protein C8J57DRAFT_1725139 [Mycena rebaudengoi]|nr:hypothetical protein C8J57DRAFT_1725139 [Mycena rebaudengoi]
MADLISVVAGAPTSGSFTGRHESSHRSELADMDRNVLRYRGASQNVSEISISSEEANIFHGKLNASQHSLDQYYKSLNEYKDESWFRLPSKMKKHSAVRKMKGVARDANQNLRQCVDSLSSDSDVSSLHTESGSPPGCALELERIGDWLGPGGDHKDHCSGVKKEVAIGDSFSNNRYIMLKNWDFYNLVGTAMEEIIIRQRLLTSLGPYSSISHPGKCHLICFLDLRLSSPQNLNDHQRTNSKSPIFTMKDIPENIYLPHIIDYNMITVQIANLENARWRGLNFTGSDQMPRYRCPEVILGPPHAGRRLTSCAIFELITNGDFLFDPMAGETFSEDDNHLAQITELLDQIPETIRETGQRSREFFDLDGKLLYVQKATASEPDPDFLLPMLALDPNARITAGELLHHEWLRDVPHSPYPFENQYPPDATMSVGVYV